MSEKKEGVNSYKNLFSYIIERLTKITGSQDTIHNLLLLAKGLLKYIKLHYTLFGHYDGELMQQPSKAILRETSGTFSDFLKKNELEILIPMMNLQSSLIAGYGSIDEIGTLYGLMMKTPSTIIPKVKNIFAKIFGMNEDHNHLYVLKKGFQHLWKTVVEKEDLMKNVIFLFGLHQCLVLSNLYLTQVMRKRNCSMA